MKKQRLEVLNAMVEQQKQTTMELCNMAGMGVDDCDESFVSLARGLTQPLTSVEEQSKPNGKWLKKLWPF
jgi:hypothetical protein